ncbi:hypothetical protein [Capillimicrobium parvum]|uniref:hypothetical protein n=1 Tax=Capillimicrobium parvum TaxID=2884022 RepID=UPI00216ABD14|nr:hypothetical protein [Capillimicrobium parvum]
MRIRLLRHPARDADFGTLLQTFLVAGVATVLVIRTQLWATNYPQLGGHGLHIAHLLYGGIFMVIAIGMLLVYLNRSIRRPAAVVGGIGFGFFIDELGKFITSDNNYFFKPAAALIYLVFVGLYLVIRGLERRRGLTQIELVSNALDLVAEAARHDFDERERRRALVLLEQADQTDPLVAPIREMLARVEALPAPRPRWPERTWSRVRDAYLNFAETQRFTRLVTAVIVLWGVLSLVFTFELVLSIGLHLGGARSGAVSDDISQLSVINWLNLVSSTVSGILVAIGVVRLRQGDRGAAYRWFERALLVSIFLTRSFAFIESQFGAVFGLGVDLLLLISINLMQKGDRENDLAQLAPAPAAAPQPARPDAVRASG